LALVNIFLLSKFQIKLLQTVALSVSMGNACQRMSNKRNKCPLWDEGLRHNWRIDKG